jgi:murein L,D-transpeptidase YcbB/YkuD
MDLQETGIIDKAAITKMNYPITETIKEILVNLERVRWIPPESHFNYILINIPEYKLYVYDKGELQFDMNVIVGKEGTGTVIFTGDLKYIVFSPYWNVPASILKKEVLPGIRRNKNYLANHNMEWNNGKVRQKPGPRNSLGLVKFLFPNRHTVYMHDTLPVRKKYFKQPVRLIGHECVRMEKPVRFAEILLAEANGWPDSRVKELWDKGNNSAVALERKIPVHMVYFTAVVEDSGKIETFADSYGLDRKLAAALFGDATGFPLPPPEPKRQEVEADATPVNRNAGSSDIARSMQGFLGE